jgi:predicted nucleic acid-binding protein
LPELLVVDCSVAVKWVLYEAGHVQALRLLEEEKSGSLMLIAPDLLLTEFASLIAKRVRRKHMSAAEAIDAFHRFEESVPALFETRPLVEAAIHLAVDGHLSLWDSVYLALALEHRCPLITADRRLFRGHSPRHPAIRLLETSNY